MGNNYADSSRVAGGLWHIYSFITISFWINEFKRGRTNTDNELRSGRPKTVTNEEMINEVLDIVMSDRRLKLREIVEMVGISEERVYNILHEILGMRKLTSRWVPRLLWVKNKRVRSKKGIIHINCLEMGKTITGKYCAECWAVSTKPYIREGESNGMEHDERQGEVSAKERGNERVRDGIGTGWRSKIELERNEREVLGAVC
ncbi:hypothetical protein ALC62_02704 [Cyphomyrmex costatus]|uniref:Histone-lysine N-methyltransferase SETMAR n=1 Tax=Cyphomyrmex costatus TaxID=456900 RepID=A0A195D0G9_9HYME|nr:hypothetical protein ALC62_02704 [Cyphomyrmex costatus]